MNTKIMQQRQELIDQIVSQMKEKGEAWRPEWTLPSAPFNPTTGKRYHGMNVFSLLFESAKRGVKDPRFMSFNQAKAKGYSVKKGAKGYKVEFWSVNEIENKKIGEIERVPFGRTSYVFNAVDIEGIEPYQPTANDFAENARAENVINSCGVPINYGGDSCTYSPTSDSIDLPERSSFENDHSFYAAAFHEISHSTGHKSRMNRDMTGTFGSVKYALEELRAELSSALVCLDLEVMDTEETRKRRTNNTVAYLKGWLAAAHNDSKAFVEAIKDACKIADYVIAYEAA